MQELALISQREIKLEMDTLKDKALVETELINSPRKFEALGQLAESLVRVATGVAAVGIWVHGLRIARLTRSDGLSTRCWTWKCRPTTPLRIYPCQNCR